MKPGSARPGLACPWEGGPGPSGTRVPAQHRAPGRLRRPGRPAVRRRSLLVLGAVTLASASLFAAALPAGAGLAADQAQAVNLQRQIVDQGIFVQQLVAQADAAQAELTILDSQVAATTAQVAADRLAAAASVAHLRQVAIAAYVSAGRDSAGLSVFEVQGGERGAATLEYQSLASGKLRQAIDTEQADTRRARAAEATLHSEQAQAAATVSRLIAERQQAQSALDHDTALLSQIHGTIAALQAAAALQQLAAQRAAQERALAAEQAQLAQQEQVIRAVPGVVPSPGSYANPVRAVADLSPERIDQGVDYSGYGPIYAIGDGVVVNTVNSGWPGGTFIGYRLTNGPAAGLEVYVAEDIQPAVSVGQRVTTATVLGTLYEGPDGMETGWADPSSQGLTMARDYGQFSGANSTAFGANFSQLLAWVGAPPGVLQNNPPTGTLPPGWPTW